MLGLVVPFMACLAFDPADADITGGMYLLVSPRSRGYRTRPDPEPPAATSTFCGTPYVIMTEGYERPE